MILVKKAVAEDFEEIYPLLLELGGTRITKEQWKQLFVDHCGSGERYFGYALADEGKLVGFLGLIFSKRLINGEEHKFCNMTSWILKKEYRGKGLGLALLLETVKLKDYTITDLTATNATVPMLKKQGFRELETNYKIILPVPTIKVFLNRCSIESDHSVIENLLTGENRKIFRDHLKFSLIHILIKTEFGNCYLILKKARRHKLILAQVHYLSDLDVFLKCLPCAVIKICFLMKVVGLLVEERFLRGHKVKNSFISRLPYPSKLFRPYRLDKIDITDNLYTEFMILDI